MANSIEIIINSRAGHRRAREVTAILERVFESSGLRYGISIAARDELSQLIQQKADTDCEILVAGGGDGTIAGVADAAFKRGKALGVLPLGTFNYFARNLAIPLELEAAARVIVEGRKREVSVLDLDGRLVLNNSSMGIHPAVLSRRRKLYRRWGRSQLNTYLSIFLTAFQAPPRLRVKLATSDAEAVRETPLVMVCSNAFEMEHFAVAGQECLEANRFALYVARMAGRLTIFRLGLRALTGTLRVGVDYEIICTSEVTIESLRRRQLRVAIDGELERMESPMRFRMNPTRLLVMAPRDERTLPENDSLGESRL